jgi:uncharacterized phage-like protein YoqJ
MMRPYEPEFTTRLIQLAEYSLIKLAPDLVISGMALGWDQAVANAAVRLKIPFHAFVPCLEQESCWPVKSREEYQLLLSHADECHYTIKAVYPGPWCMQKRNEEMVDASDKVLALYDGSTFGGTFNCLTYANKKSVPAVNSWNRWISQDF